MSMISHGRIGTACHWCNDKGGYDIKENVFAPHLVANHDRSKKFMGICGRCFHCTPSEKTKEECIATIEKGPLFKPENPQKCFWCKKNHRRQHADGDRAWLQLQLQGFIHNSPMSKFADVHYTMCDNCQHCTPIAQTKREALRLAMTSCTFEPTEKNYVPPNPDDTPSE